MIRIHPTGHPERTIILDGQLGQLDTWQASKESLNGWYGLNSARYTPPDRPWGHGGYPVRGWRGPRSFAIEGWADLSSIGAGQAMMDQLASLKSSDITGTAVVIVRERDGVERWREVEVHSALVDDSEPLSLEYTVECIAADPRRYGPPIEAGQIVPASTGDVNRLTNPSFASDATGWHASVQGGSGAEFPLARVAHGYDGWMGRFVLGSVASGLAVTYRGIPAAGVRDVIVAAHASINTTLRLSLSWIGAGGVVLETWSGAPVEVLAGVPQQLSTVVSAVPAGAVSLTVTVDGYGRSGGWPAGSSLGVHRALVGVSPDGGIHDGDSVGWSWDGAPGSSTSRRSGAVWVLDNRDGTAPSWPRVFVAPWVGPLATFSVTLPGGGRVVWTGPAIQPGSIVEIIPERRQMLLDGSLPSRAWTGLWGGPVEPGTVETVAVSSPGTAFTAEYHWSPAWW